MRILHISDIHVDEGLELSSVLKLNKRAVGFANLILRRRMHYRHASAMVRALAEYCLREKVDVVVCTGDLTALGTESEFAAVMPLLRLFDELPHGLITFPGNHDVYLHDSVPVAMAQLAPWMDSSSSEWPRVRLLGEKVAVVSVRSARPNPDVRVSSGRVADDEVQRLATLCRSPELQGRTVFVATHYGFRLANGEPDRPSHGLENAGEVMHAIAPLPRKVVLHGHVHRRYSVALREAKAMAFCAGSTTMSGREGFWLFDTETEQATEGSFVDGIPRLKELVVSYL